ncbi:MAG: hypothetical protein CVT48_01610 [Thermoplasmata archaeon HGW-Thermoplasmata-1]|nr:MAG: hypothetical protein CVT48_01610 [Thermoplasmata archaeon HGW-Thermoplasmata-1]
MTKTDVCAGGLLAEVVFISLIIGLNMPAAFAQTAQVELVITVGTITHIDEVDPGVPQLGITDQFNEADWYYS